MKKIHNGETGSIDVGLLVPPIENEKISYFPVREETFVACLPKLHPLANQKEPVDIKKFANERIIMTPKSAGKG